VKTRHDGDTHGYAIVTAMLLTALLLVVYDRACDDVRAHAASGPVVIAGGQR
jgi:hypothetical protein